MIRPPPISTLFPYTPLFRSDFDVVIAAVIRLEERIRGWEAGDAARRFPELVILVTGDGARRAEFERRFAGLPARRIQLDPKSTRLNSRHLVNSYAVFCLKKK